MNTIAAFALGPAWTAFGSARSRWAGSARSVLAFLLLSAVRGLASMAAADVFGMIPITPAMNWYAIIGGAVVATLLMLVTLPALRAAWFRLASTREPGHPHRGNERATDRRDRGLTTKRADAG